MRFYVSGTKKRNERHYNFRQIWDICNKENITIPDEVKEYFNYNVQNRNDFSVEVPSQELNTASTVGIEININEIPDGIEVLNIFVMKNEIE